MSMFLSHVPVQSGLWLTCWAISVDDIEIAEPRSSRQFPLIPWVWKGK